MADGVFQRFKKVLLDRSDTGAGVDFDTDTLKIILLTAVPADTQWDAWNTYSQVTTELTTAGGYTVGGITLSGVTLTQDDTNNRIAIDATDPSWATFTATGILAALIYKSTGTSSTSAVICSFDFGGTKNGGGGTFTVQFSSSPSAFLTVT